MNKIMNNLNIKIILSAILLVLTLCFMTITSYSWLINDSSANLNLYNDKIKGLSINVYRGYDHDLNGALDFHEKKDGDLNEKYIKILDDDKVSMMESSIVTYRCVIKNDSEFDIKVNPFFTFDEASKYYSVLFLLKDTFLVEHTFKNHSYELIDTSKNYDLKNGLYDVNNQKVFYLTDGINTYDLVYKASGDVNVISETDSSTKVDLTKLYNSTFYSKDKSLIKDLDNYDLKKGLYDYNGKEINAITNGILNYKLTYTSENVLVTASDSRFNEFVNLKQFYKIQINSENKSLSSFISNENYKTLELGKKSEHYFDWTIKAASLETIRDEINTFKDKKSYQHLISYYDLTKGLYNEETKEEITKLEINGIIYELTYNKDGVITVNNKNTIVDLSSLTNYETREMIEFNKIANSKANAMLTNASLDIKSFSFDCDIISGISIPIDGGTKI